MRGMSRFEIDLAKPIFGSQHPQEMDRSILCDERMLFRFFIGEHAVTIAVLVHEIDVISGYTHLERFTGTDVSDVNNGEEGIVPGKSLTAVKDLRYKHVFVTHVDGEPLAVHEGFFGEDETEPTP